VRDDELGESGGGSRFLASVESVLSRSRLRRSGSPSRETGGVLIIALLRCDAGSCSVVLSADRSSGESDLCRSQLRTPSSRGIGGGVIIALLRCTGSCSIMLSAGLENDLCRSRLRGSSSHETGGGITFVLLFRCGAGSFSTMLSRSDAKLVTESPNSPCGFLSELSELDENLLAGGPRSDPRDNTLPLTLATFFPAGCWRNAERSSPVPPPPPFRTDPGFLNRRSLRLPLLERRLTIPGRGGSEETEEYESRRCSMRFVGMLPVRCSGGGGEAAA